MNSNLLQLKLFGSPQIHFQGQPLNGFVSAKVRALLIYLAVTNRPHSRDHLAELLWADTPASRRKNLKKALSNLRNLPGVPLCEDTGGLVYLAQAQFWVDVHTFERVLQQADLASVDELQRAVELYQADFLAGFNLSQSYEFEAWTLAEQSRLKATMIEGLQRLAALYEGMGQGNNAIVRLRQLLALEPWHEEIHRQLMLILVRRGDRGAAIQQYERCRQALAEELAVEPDAKTQELVEQIRAGHFEQTSTKVEPSGSASYESTVDTKSNLPTQSLPLIGRAPELQALSRLLTDATSRLITILGAGGMGKSHLAMVAALHQVEQFKDGVYWVALASIVEAKEIIFAIITALGLPLQGGRSPEQQLYEFLRERHLLLVLDNVEHLIEGVPFISELLSKTTRLWLLITSRQRLMLSNETILRLNGLPFPPTMENTTTNTTNEYAAIQLFLQRSRLVAPYNYPNPQALAGVIEICRLVDGMPLGIILAAAWSNLLSPSEIAAEIKSDLNFLQTELEDIPKRQQSLRMVFMMTWSRLSEAERAVLMSLSVFVGGFTRAAAQQVANATLSIMAALHDKALLWRTADGRYEIHELLRQYAAEMLTQSGQGEIACRSHSHYFLMLVERCTAALKGGNQLIAFAELSPEQGNLRQAWHWAVRRGEIAALAGAIDGFALFYRISGRHQEGENICDLAIKMLQKEGLELGPSAQRLYAKLLTWFGWFGCELGQTSLARQKSEQSLLLLDELAARGHDVRAERATTLLRLADFVWHEDVEQSQRLLLESLGLNREIGDEWQTAVVLRDLARACWAIGDLRQSQQFAEESLAIRRAIADQVGTTQSLAILCWIAQRQGLGQKLLHHASEFLTMGQQIGSQEVQSQALFNLGMAHLFNGYYCEAVRWLEQARQLASKLRNRPHANTCTIWLADAQIHLGAYDQASTTVELTLRTSDEIGLTSHRADVLLLLACLHVVDGKYDAAATCLTESITFMHQSYYLVKLPRLFALLGQVKRAMGNQADAQRYCDQALQLAKAQGNVEGLALTLPLAALLMFDNAAYERAVEQYAAARTHPYLANSCWFADVIGPAVIAAKSNLDPETVRSAEDRGRALGILGLVNNPY